MSRAVRFDRYGGIDVLGVVNVDPPTPGPGQALVRIKAAGINPGEAKIREGLLHSRFPATFPSGEGSDLAGIVEQVAPGVDGVDVGDEVIGFTNDRASHAELAVVDADHLTPRPPNVPWEVAGALFVAGATAYAAVDAVGAACGDVVVVAGAAGGVGSIAVQLARRAGAKVIGIASERHHEWLSARGVIPVGYGDGLQECIRDAAGGQVDALIDAVGSGYVELALDLGARPERIDTIADFQAAEKFGVQIKGSAAGASAGVLAELAALIDRGELEIPIAGVYRLEQVRDAFAALEQGHVRGKIVLVP